MITITVTQNASAGLREEQARLHAAVLRGVERATVGIQIDVVQNKLHGQVLQQRSGNLARNVIALPVVDSGDAVSGVVGVGSTAWYGKIHEFGGVFDVVRTHKAASGIYGPQWFGTAYKMTVPERSFMRASLRENTANGKIREWIEAPIREVMS